MNQKLNADQARNIIKRMQQKAGNTIEDKDVEIIVRYHLQAQQKERENSIQGTFNQFTQEQLGMKSSVLLFLEKCSTCHRPSRALGVMKDPETWAQTIKRMQ